MSPSISRRAAQRRAAAVREAEASPLAAHLADILSTYRPDGITDSTWAEIRHTHADVMARSGVVGRDSFKKHLKVVALYLSWRHDHGGSMELTDALAYDLIDSWYLNGTSQLSDKTRNDYRSRMRNVAAHANPGLAAAPQIAKLGHRSVRPGYTPAEAAALRRIALRQSRPSQRRNLCAVIGLCQGAGLDSQDLRGLIGRHVCDHGDTGIEVHVPGNRARTTWVRHDHEELVRIGIEGIRRDELVLGKVAERRNIVSGIVDKADLFDDVPHLEASRLRATWLTVLMSEHVPVNVILDAAGLKSARTLTELVAAMPAPDSTDARNCLRGEQS